MLTTLANIYFYYLKNKNKNNKMNKKYQNMYIV